MGLAGAKNKRRLGNDPNNTKWSRNTESFGQKMLRSQGWEPGQYLGAKDATHTEYHSEASASHIRVVLKDDMLGLGAKRNNGDECTGLDAFQHLLGRLNGKTEEVLETEKRERDNLKLNLYLDRKVGMIRFVPGGFLVGDVVKEKLDEDAGNSPVSSAQDGSRESTEDNTEAEPTEKKSKKRKAERDTDRNEEKARKKEKKIKRRKTDSDVETDSERAKDKKKDKKDKKLKKRSKTDSDEGDIEQPTSSRSSSKRKKEKDQAADESSDYVSVEDAKKAKKEKKRAKKEKKERKEKRSKDKAASESGSESEDGSSKEKKRRKEDKTPAESGDSTATPSGSGYSTPVTTSTRYLARSRFIAQKKMAFADSAALNQIFMIKS
ncbi:protein PXR1 [Cladorrhinum sp. PSN332]|nr:protein PXR1 [Cladorrhinum sp. PSN332]